MTIVLHGLQLVCQGHLLTAPPSATTQPPPLIRHCITRTIFRCPFILARVCQRRGPVPKPSGCQCFPCGGRLHTFPRCLSPQGSAPSQADQDTRASPCLPAPRWASVAAPLLAPRRPFPETRIGDKRLCFALPPQEWPTLKNVSQLQPNDAHLYPDLSSP